MVPAFRRGTPSAREPCWRKAAPYAGGGLDMQGDGPRAGSPTGAPPTPAGDVAWDAPGRTDIVDGVPDVEPLDPRCGDVCGASGHAGSASAFCEAVPSRHSCCSATSACGGGAESVLTERPASSAGVIPSPQRCIACLAAVFATATFDATVEVCGEDVLSFTMVRAGVEARVHRWLCGDHPISGPRMRGGAAPAILDDTSSDEGTHP